jgi:hypothetical protein
MNRFEPQRLVTKERYWQFENADGVEFIAHGDDSRYELLWRIIDELETTQATAIRRLESFMKDSGEFTLELVEVLSQPSDAVDFFLRFAFFADRDRHGYTYTYFDVFFNDALNHPRPHFWPCKFTIGFR